MNRLLTLLLIVFILPVSRGAAQISALSADKNIPPVRVLRVVAQPDDEYEMTGTVYRIAKELSGTVDQLILTDGEAGYHYTGMVLLHRSLHKGGPTHPDSPTSAD